MKPLANAPTLDELASTAAHIVGCAASTLLDRFEGGTWSSRDARAILVFSASVIKGLTRPPSGPPARSRVRSGLRGAAQVPRMLFATIPRQLRHQPPIPSTAAIRRASASHTLYENASPTSCEPSGGSTRRGKYEAISTGQ